MTLNAQCPQELDEGTPGGSTNIKCILVSWSSPPTLSVTTIVANGITYKLCKWCWYDK